ncbi:tryptophan-rich sensory protein [Aurantibacter crassamenti]|uniref:tryptophan-rich sensory protein n=1 Tax=Aurantibacter crassamenti TaxID=1837375 RepID=UPI0019397167|nr:tryptophan-rich sensory protein [Aurantibacter crassamenti]MBM1105555.1 tryptophan-rich sensory protein [Aurantibacter crassamenti]
MQKKLSILNLASVILVIVVNYISQAIRINETTIGEVSNKYYNLFTPAGYAFAIWGLVFTALIAYGIYQVRIAFYSEKSEKLINETGYWLIITNILNCVWVFVFAHEYTGLSVLVMLGILFSLIKIIMNTNMERETVSRSTYIFGWLPIGIYCGWIAVATIANISAYLSKLNFDGGFLSESNWTIIMIAIATSLNLIMILKRKMYEFATVGIWALFAIYMRHQNDHESIAHVALAGCAIILITIIWKILKTKKKLEYKLY